MPLPVLQVCPQSVEMCTGYIELLLLSRIIIYRHSPEEGDANQGNGTSIKARLGCLVAILLHCILTLGHCGHMGLHEEGVEMHPIGMFQWLYRSSHMGLHEKANVKNTVSIFLQKWNLIICR